MFDNMGYERGFDEAKKYLFGDPDAIKQAYEQAMGMSRQMGQESKDFLMGQQAKALQFYAPMQQMFTSMYGTKGMKPAQAPGVPGATPGGR